MKTINKEFLRSHNCYIGQNNPKYVIQHETDNTSYGAGARIHAKAQYNGNLGKASVHFYVDDKEIYQCLNIEDGSWNCGDGDGSSGINNRNTISIELCVNPDSNYEIARNNAIELCAYLLHQQGWGVSRLKTHNNATGKWCPRRILNDGYWDTFKSKVNSLLNGGSIEIPESESSSVTKSLQEAKEFIGDRCGELQEKLIKCGYDCGGYGADNKFGMGTYNSLIQFQKDSGLVPDALAGTLTFKKLDEKISSDNNTSSNEDYSCQGKYGVVTGNDVRLRDSASTNSNILGYTNKGDKFKIGYRLGDWYSIYWGEHGAFISASYLNVVSEVGSNNIQSSSNDSYEQHGNATVLVDKLMIRTAPSINANVVGSYSKGQTIYSYDYVYNSDGYRWIRYMGGSGNYRYVAVRRLSDNKKYANCY